MSGYTELIDRLRGHNEDYMQDKTQRFAAVCKDCKEAADAIETLSKGINAYSDEAFKRAQECNDLKKRIAELEQMCIEYEARAAERNEPYPPALNVMYICDRRKCDKCDPTCSYTGDVRHAKHFEVAEWGGLIYEQEGSE